MESVARAELAVLYDVTDGIATVTLNRPDRLNTMSPELMAGTIAALTEAASDDSVRALVLTGAGRAFCAGGDLKRRTEGRDSLSAEAQASGSRRPMAADVGLLRANMRTSQLLREMPKVTIAAVNGACAGAGLAWACAADIRYAAESAVFNTAFMTAGLSGDFGGTWTLPRIVGPSKARELYLMAEKFGSEEALRIGLVSAVVPDEQLMTLVRERASRVAGFAPLTVQAIKANLNDALDVDFSTQLDREAERHIRVSRTEDATEAARAFLEKRPPAFRGR